MGDVGSIAAQGRTTYDLSDFVSPAHPLPAGCNIRIEGMAPGASVVALKVFANNLLTAPTSTIVQAIDYAVNIDHVNVLNESFGANPYPDNATDPISIANQDAIDAGVAVTASTGDVGHGQHARHRVHRPERHRRRGKHGRAGVRAGRQLRLPAVERQVHQRPGLRPVLRRDRPDQPGAGPARTR